MFQDMDQNIFDCYKPHFVDILSLWHIPVYKLEEHQCIQEHKNKLLDHWFVDIESLFHKEMVDKDLFQQVLKCKYAWIDKRNYDQPSSNTYIDKVYTE